MIDLSGSNSYVSNVKIPLFQVPEARPKTGYATIFANQDCAGSVYISNVNVGAVSDTAEGVDFFQTNGEAAFNFYGCSGTGYAYAFIAGQFSPSINGAGNQFPGANLLFDYGGTWTGEYGQFATSYSRGWPSTFSGIAPFTGGIASRLASLTAAFTTSTAPGTNSPGYTTPGNISQNPWDSWNVEANGADSTGTNPAISPALNGTTCGGAKPRKRHNLPIWRSGIETRAGCKTGQLYAADDSHGWEREIPQGTGYATLTVSARGGAIMAGKLSDGESFSATGAITGIAGNQFVLSKSLSYPSVASRGAKGLLSGTLTFVPDTGTRDLWGTVEWTKPRQTRGAYPAVIDENLNVAGSIFAHSRATSVLPGFTTGILELSDTGALSAAEGGPLEQGLTFKAANTFKPAHPSQDELKVRVTASGVFKGSFLYPGKKSATDFWGVLYQDRVMGEGFFVGPNGSGRVSLMPAP